MKVMSIEFKEKHHFGELRDDEILSIGGGFGPPGAIVGGTTAWLAYVTEKAISNEKITFGGMGTAIGVGAVGGALGGPISTVRSIWSINFGIAAGSFTGLVNALGSVPRRDTSYWSDFSFDFSTF